MSGHSPSAENCLKFLRETEERFENIQTWLENEERTFRGLLSPLQSSRVGNLNPAQLDSYKEQIKLFQPQLKGYTRMLVDVLQQLSIFEFLLFEIEWHLNDHGLRPNGLRPCVIIIQLENEIDDLSDRICTILQIVTMFRNLHYQLQQLHN